LRDQLIERISGVQDPDNGRPMVKKVHRREEVYNGPFLDRAADLILEPEAGYDPKANLDKGTIASRGEIGGMHTLDDAFVLMYPGQLPERSWQLMDLMPGVLGAFGVRIPPGSDGVPWLEAPL
jgi:predicted AlkP superfamily phosphohydrolase/phosphomutase